MKTFLLVATFVLSASAFAQTPDSLANLAAIAVEHDETPRRSDTLDGWSTETKTNLYLKTAVLLDILESAPKDVQESPCFAGAKKIANMSTERLHVVKQKHHDNSLIRIFANTHKASEGLFLDPKSGKIVGSPTCRLS